MNVLRTRASTAAIVGSLIILACAAGALLAPWAAPSSGASCAIAFGAKPISDSADVPTSNLASQSL
jgi:hypothetical protein